VNTVDSTQNNPAASESGSELPADVSRWLMAVSEACKPGRADAVSLVDLLVEIERRARATQAARYRVLAALERHPDYGRGPAGDAAVEVACALRISERTAQSQVAEARVLARVFPEALECLAAGRVQGAQVRALVKATGALGERAARAVQERVLGRMSEQNPAATRKALARAVLRVDPRGAECRHEVARRQRRVCLTPEPDGMGTLAVTLPGEQAVHAMAVIDAHARAARQRDRGAAGADAAGVRTLEQARADSFYALVTGCQQAYPPAVVQVTVPLDTLLGIGDQPGELGGYGPVGARTARMLAAGQHAVWRRLLTAPQSGLLVHAEAHTYRPTAQVRRQVSARDGYCSFPTCAMPAARCDLDHVTPFDHRRPERGGPTTAENLQPLCRRHHRLKTHGRWSVRHSETPTITVWTSPSGHSYQANEDQGITGRG
jgi:Domain of unknown function (DUF222)/HNH endonuclease